MIWLWKIRWWFEDRLNDAAVAICQLVQFADGGSFHYGSDGTSYVIPKPERGLHIHIAGEAGQIASAPYPHCDDLVLHAPGKCEVCDLYPTYQAARIAKGVNFTGEHRADRTPCPATLRRPLETIERWPGNREWEA